MISQITQTLAAPARIRSQYFGPPSPAARRGQNRTQPVAEGCFYCATVQIAMFSSRTRPCLAATRSNGLVPRRHGLISKADYAGTVADAARSCRALTACRGKHWPPQMATGISGRYGVRARCRLREPYRATDPQVQTDAGHQSRGVRPRRM